jgi:hypothetical protein
MMDVPSTYKKIIDEIAKGHRGLIRLSEEEAAFLSEELLCDNHTEEILCIIEHASLPSLKFEKNLMIFLNRSVSDQFLIFALNCARRHIIEARMVKGQRLEFDFLETLKKLLFHKNPEVVEWTLRLIEGCGNQGIYFLREFDKIKPPPWKWFNAHQRAVREIITLLERRWSPIEKSSAGSGSSS